nr:immunoglobulin heavy chain junction region [Mus musculus]
CARHADGYYPYYVMDYW